MPDKDNWQDKFGELLHEGEMGLCGLRLVQYLNDAGEKKFRVRWSGDAEITDLIGTLELVKGELVLHTLTDNER